MIYVCEYDGSGKREDLTAFWEKLDFWQREGQSEASGQRWEKLRQRLTAWKLLDAAVRREWGLPGIEALGVRRTPEGKPWGSAHPELSFNLSHCDAACACILSEQGAGIDVERLFPYKPSLAKAVCTDREWRLLRGMEEREREQALRLLWSMKESYVKLDGRGLGFGMKKVELAPALDRGLLSRMSLLLSVSPGAPPVGFLITQTDRYTLAACGPSLPVGMFRCSEAELWKKTDRKD